MMTNTVSYKKSTKKQVIYALLWFACLCAIGFTFRPISTPIKFAAFSFICVLFTAYAFYGIRKAAQEAKCPFCGADLYETVAAAKQTKIQMKYCPACGNEIQV